MPIYEFYCPDCHTVFSFFSATVDTEARPACPRCGRPELGRRPSRFATLKGGVAGAGEEEGGDSPIPGLDEGRMERAMEQLAGEMGDLSGDESPDPRQLARFMRRFGEVSGLEPGAKLEEMLHKLESGADPESLEDDLGGGGGDDEMDDAAAFAELFKGKKEGGRAARSKRPAVDETLHFL